MEDYIETALETSEEELLTVIEFIDVTQFPIDAFMIDKFWKKIGLFMFTMSYSSGWDIRVLRHARENVTFWICFIDTKKIENSLVT